MLRQEAARQKADDCAQLKPTPAPDIARIQLEATPADPAQQTPDQKALVAWMNHDAAEVQNHLTYCPKGATP